MVIIILNIQLSTHLLLCSPTFDGLFEYCQTYSGGSVDAAAMLGRGEVDMAFNWSGGMHHAKKGEASGRWINYSLWFELAMHV